MKLIKDNIRRCGIFLYYDKECKVDDYVINLLKDLKESVEDILVVCNGYIPEETESRFRQVTDQILIRANAGFDVGGYREGMFYLGFQKLCQYDEVVMLNYTFFGPIYPFAEMFDSMAERDLDFWGITGHFRVDPDPYGANRYGYMPEHIQSHFIVVRRSMLESNEYREFMISMKNPASYTESICDYESIFLKHFTDLGFKGATYCDEAEYEGYVFNPVMFRLKNMIEKKRCPIIKRRSFFTEYSDFLLNSCGEGSAEAYEYIRDVLHYDTNPIWDNLLRLENMTEIARAMQLNYMLSQEDLLNGFFPEQRIALYILVNSEKYLSEYQKAIADMKLSMDVHWIMDQKEETNSKALMDILTDTKTNYEYIGVLRVMDVENHPPYSNNISWQYADWKNVVATKTYIRNVFTCFDENERMGLLIPPAPEFGSLFARREDGWYGRYGAVELFLMEHGITVNFKRVDEPLAPVGGSFWIKTAGIKELLAQKNQLVEELSANTDYLQMMLILPFLVQQGGYYTGTAYNMDYASIAVTNQDYMMRELNRTVFPKYGANLHVVVQECIERDDFVNKR